MEDNSQKIVVFGAGGHAKVVIDALEACGTPPEAVYDDNQQLWKKTYYGYEVIGGLAALSELKADNVAVVIGIAVNQVRFKLAHQLSAMGLRLRGVRHPSAIVSRSAVVAESAQLMGGTIINPDARIGEHSIVNTGGLIEHDTCLDKFIHIGPGAMLSGAVKVLEGAFIGTGACVIPFQKVGAWATVGGGSVVIDEVPDGTTVVGSPARDVRKKG